MKVAVDKITSQGLQVEEKIAADSWDMSSHDVVFIDPISVVTKFEKKSDLIYVETAIAVEREITCSRCLEKDKQTTNHNFSKIYSLGSLEEYLDIDKELREEILINFPMKVLCRPDCKGLCPSCGVNLNSEECKCK